MFSAIYDFLRLEKNKDELPGPGKAGERRLGQWRSMEERVLRLLGGREARKWGKTGSSGLGWKILVKPDLILRQRAKRLCH